MSKGTQPDGKLLTGLFAAFELEPAEFAGLHRCPRCATEMTTTVPSTRAPKCPRCRWWMAPVNAEVKP